MKKLKLLVAILIIALNTFSQTRVEPFQIDYRDEHTRWEFVTVDATDMPYLYFYTDGQANFRNKITKIKITNGWNDVFKIVGAGEVIRGGSAMKWKAVDGLGKNCIVELVAREYLKTKYTQLYIRYVNLEYVYSFTTQ